MLFAKEDVYKKAFELLLEEYIELSRTFFCGWKCQFDNCDSCPVNDVRKEKFWIKKSKKELTKMLDE